MPTRVFVGGLPWTISEVKIKEYFSCFGLVLAIEMMLSESGVSRGFCYVTFATAKAANEVLYSRYLCNNIDGKWVDCQLAHVQLLRRPAPLPPGRLPSAEVKAESTMEHVPNVLAQRKVQWGESEYSNSEGFASSSGSLVSVPSGISTAAAMSVEKARVYGDVGTLPWLELTQILLPTEAQLAQAKDEADGLRSQLAEMDRRRVLEVSQVQDELSKVKLEKDLLMRDLQRAETTLRCHEEEMFELIPSITKDLEADLQLLKVALTNFREERKDARANDQKRSDDLAKLRESCLNAETEARELRQKLEEAVHLWKAEKVLRKVTEGKVLIDRTLQAIPIFHEAEFKSEYRRLARIFHPDKHNEPGEANEIAKQCFLYLQKWREKAESSND